MLEELGAKLVLRSAGSKGLVDLFAIFPEKKQVWAVQVKKREAPKDPDKLRKEFHDLAELRGDYHVTPYVYMKKNGKYTFIELDTGGQTFLS
jgi:hypothetical protein